MFIALLINLFPYILISILIMGIGSILLFRVFGFIPPFKEQWQYWKNHK